MAPLIPTEMSTRLLDLSWVGFRLPRCFRKSPVCRHFLFARQQSPMALQSLPKVTNYADRKLVIIEDVVTSGGQIRESGRQLRSGGAIIKHVLCVIDREAGGVAKLGEDQLFLSALFTMSQFEGCRWAAYDS